MATNFAVATAIGIRRQLDSDTRSISLQRLLRAIAQKLCERPSILSRKNFLSKLSARAALGWEKQFDKLAGSGATQVEVGFICRDLRCLRDKTEKVRRFANKRVAHWDRHAVTKVQLAELDESLDQLARLVDEYARILTGSGSTGSPAAATWLETGL